MHAFILVLYEITQITDDHPFELLFNIADEQKLSIAMQQGRGLNYMIEGRTISLQIPDLGPFGRYAEETKGQSWIAKVMPKSDNRKGDVRRDKLIKDYFFEISDSWRTIMQDRARSFDIQSMNWHADFIKESRWDHELERRYSSYGQQLMMQPTDQKLIEKRHNIRQAQLLLDQIGYECIHRERLEVKRQEHERLDKKAKRKEMKRQDSKSFDVEYGSSRFI